MGFALFMFHAPLMDGYLSSHFHRRGESWHMGYMMTLALYELFQKPNHLIYKNFTECGIYLIYSNGYIYGLSLCVHLHFPDPKQSIRHSQPVLI